MKRIALFALATLALVSAHVTPVRAEPLVLGEEQLDLVTAGYAGNYTGMLYEGDGTTQAGTFNVKINKQGKVAGTVNVDGLGKYKLSGLLAGSGFGAVLKKGKAGAGGFFANLATEGSGYRMSGTWGVSSPSGALLGGGVLTGGTR